MSSRRTLPALAVAATLAFAACESPSPSEPAARDAAPTVAEAFTGDPGNVAVSWFQGFETDVVDWSAAVQVPSGSDGLTSPAGSFHGRVPGGAFSRFGAYSDTWPGAYVAEVDVYLDPAWSAGAGFDYSVASSGADGAHRRDFIFHVGVVADGRLLVNGDNNTYGGVNDFILINGGDGTPFEVTAAGWYTMQHVFYDEGGVLAVDMNLMDASGNTVFTITRSDASDDISLIGGNRYAWFVFATLPDVAIDNHRLGVVVVGPGSKDDCKNGGWEAFGYRNQGQCVASVQAAAPAGKS